VNDWLRAVVGLEAAESKQSGDLARDEGGCLGAKQPARVVDANPVGRRHRRQEQHGGHDTGHQTRHQQPETPSGRRILTNRRIAAWKLAISVVTLLQFLSLG